LGTAVLFLATLLSLSCTNTGAFRAKAAGKPIAEERAALNRWAKGEPAGYLEVLGPEITYFNPFLDHRIDGFAEMSADHQRLAGEVRIDRCEMADPRVQGRRDVAVVSDHVYDSRTLPGGSEEETTRWNSTEVSAWSDGDRRVAHNHWAFLKPAGPQKDTDRAKGIDELVQNFFDSGDFPSLSVGLVESDTLVYARSLGVADRATGRQATTDTIYEIGSVGKVFTATVLAILHDRGVLRIDDPVEKWVPAIVDVPKPAEGGPHMTLEHLATHTSGLPAVPAKVGHLPAFQWKGYSAEDLHAGFKKTELRRAAGQDLVYSTFGMGLLGHVTSVATQRPYEQVIADELLLPLGMRDTVISLQPRQEERYSVGYPSDDASGDVPYYEYGILAGGGAHRSTVADLAKFLKAQWGFPEIATNPLNARVRSELHRIRWQSKEDGGASIALGWFADPREGVGTVLVHRGRTLGHGAVVAFIPERKVGVVLLANRGGRDANIRMATFAEELLLVLVSGQENPGADASG
jgi:CubicO group peptidase (beta-lactamase class C family)